MVSGEGHPARRLHLSLELEADDLAEVERALEHIAWDLERAGDEDREVISGGWASGYHMTLSCNPEQTGDKYRAELSEWISARRNQRKSEEA